MICVEGARTSRRQLSNRDRSLSSLCRHTRQSVPSHCATHNAVRWKELDVLVLLLFQVLNGLVLLFQRGVRGEYVCGVEL